MRVLRLLVVVAAQLAVLGRAPGGWACSCVPSTEQERFERADAVFVGVVLGSRQGSTEHELVWSLDTEEVLKGAVTDPQEVTSPAQSSACGVLFEVGRRYRVYAQAAGDGTLATSICAGTRPEGDADTASPHVAFATRDGTVLVSTPVLREEVRGTAADDRSGVGEVSVRFVLLAGPVAVRSEREPALACDAARLACTWSADPPEVPGRYEVQARATDRAGNRSPAVSITVVVA